MQFDYEIPVDQYVAAQMLYYKAYGKSRFIKRALGWVLLGLFFFLIALFRGADWGPVLLLLTGAWYIYGGIPSLFPTRHGGIASLYHTRYFRGAYPESGLAGKNDHAELDENGFSVRGDSCSWVRFHVQCQGHAFHIWETVPNRCAAKGHSSICRYAVTLDAKSQLHSKPATQGRRNGAHLR